MDLLPALQISKSLELLYIADELMLFFSICIDWSLRGIDVEIQIDSILNSCGFNLRCYWFKS